MAYALMVVYLAGSIIFWPNGTMVRDQREIMFLIAVGFGVAWYVGKKVDVWAGLIAGYVLMQECRGSGSSIQIGVLIGLGLMYAVGVKAELKAERVYDVICTVVIVNVIFQVMQWWGIWTPIAQWDTVQYMGVMGNKNETSALLGCSIVAFMRKGWWKWIWICLLGLVLADSLQGLVAAIAGVCAWLWHSGRLNWRYVAGAVAIGGMFLLIVKPLNFESQKHVRLDIWEDTIKVASVKPVVGWGMNRYYQVIPLLTSFKYIDKEDRDMLRRTLSDDVALEKAAAVLTVGDRDYFNGPHQQAGLYAQAHNEYVEMLFMGGVVGLMLMLLFLFDRLRAARSLSDPAPFAGLVSLCVASALGFQWHLVPLLLLTMAYLVLAWREPHRNVRQPLPWLVYPFRRVMKVLRQEFSPSSASGQMQPR